MLERRIAWLGKRIKSARQEKRFVQYDITERNALVWALDAVKQWVDLGPEDEEEV